MARVLLAFFFVFFQTAIVTESKVELRLYANGNCGGHTNTNNLDHGGCFNWPNFGFEVSGAEILRGSCFKLHYFLNCEGQTYMLGYPYSSLCTMPCCNWNDHVLSVSDCSTRNVDIVCPEGSYVRVIQRGSANEGITIFCYKPTENTPTYSGNTHGNSPSNPITTACPIAAHGLSVSYNYEWEIFYTPTMECSRKLGTPTKYDSVTRNHYRFEKPKRVEEVFNEDNNATLRSRTFNNSMEIQELCNAGDALVGFSATIDEADVIKEASYWCRRVPDPTSMCEPQETLGLVFHCDNSASSGELQCTYSKTIGVGVSKTITETERKEMTFSAEFGFTVEAGIPGLSASMSATLGYSELVGYEWSRSDTTTWTEETTISASITVPPYTHIRMDQLIGKCSFYGTSANFFKTTDVNVKTGETTIKYFSM